MINFEFMDIVLIYGEATQNTLAASRTYAENFPVDIFQILLP